MNWLLATWNKGLYLGIEETCLSTGEVNAILANKEKRGRNGCIVAIVKGMKAKEVIKPLKRMLLNVRLKVTEITLNFSDSMRKIAISSFPNVMFVLDRFHHQQFCLAVVQELRIRCRPEVMTEVANQQERYRLWLKEYAANYELKDEHGNTLRRNVSYHA